MSAFTPIMDIDQKIDILDHVNQDHTEELLAIARTSQPKSEIQSAKILDIFEEGMKILIKSNQQDTEQEAFVPFEIEGGLEDKILYQAYAAIAQQGKDFSGAGKHFFEVTDKQKVTPNMIRISVKSNTPLPEYYPGYAFAFLLKIIQKKPNLNTQTNQNKHWFKNIFDRAFIKVMKHLSSKNRQKLLQKANKDIRLYTLRKSWRSSEDAAFPDMGYIDIFTHDNTPGSQWASELKAGDVIMSRSESPDKHPHLKSGQALLIADETAYPALVGILETWNNPLPPHVIILSAKSAEQDYIEDALLPEGSQVHRLVCDANKQADEILPILAKLETVDVAWAAFESESAKKVRRYLRNDRNIIGRDNHTKAYWQLKSRPEPK